MDRSPGISQPFRHAPPNDPPDSAAAQKFHQAVLKASDLHPEKRYAYLRDLLQQVATLNADKTEALTDLGMMNCVLSADESLQMTEALANQFLQLSHDQTADMRADNAKKLASGIISAADLHDVSTTICTIVKLGHISRTLDTDRLAKILIEEIYDHLPSSDPTIAGQRIAQAAELVPHLPTALTQNYLESLTTYLPEDAASRSATIPAILDFIPYAPASADRQDLNVRLNQLLYQSRLAEPSAQ